jgi:hypothetical protein
VVPGLPSGTDARFHVGRLLESDYLIRHGLLFSRWSPHLGYGYGFPMFNFYPRLLYYLAEPLLLAGMGASQALQIVIGLAVAAGAVGAYRWVAGRLGPGPGVVASAAFIFSPYVIYTLLGRSGFPEILALACMPWGLWGLHRYADRRGLAYGVVVALVVAGLMLTHLPSALLFLATLLVYAMVLGLTSDHTQGVALRTRGVAILRLSWPIALGLALAAFFWIPALVESNLVQIERLLELGDPSTGKGLVPLWRAFSGRILPEAGGAAGGSPHLSGLAAGLGLVGVASGWAALRSRRLKLEVLLAAVVALLAVFMLTRASRWLWRAVPMLRLVHFPVRLLGVASLWLAFLVGAAAAALLALLPVGEGASVAGTATTAMRVATGGVVALLSLALALPAFGPRGRSEHAPRPPQDLAQALAFERDAQTMGFLAASEYLPVAVRELPPAESGPAVGQARLDEGTLPEDARLVAAEYDLLNYAVVVDSPVPFQAVINTFDYPGWRAQIDGQTVPITPADPYGLISLSVPAGQHRIEVRFGSTPLRSAAAALSLVGAVMILALSVICIRHLALPMWWPFETRSGQRPSRVFPRTRVSPEGG